MPKINTVIVEDSDLARFELKALLGEFDDINVLGEAADIEEAKALIEHLDPDLVFMDIDLPGGTAFDILSALSVVPKLIFTTAFDQFALQAFEHNTVDYLLKPIKHTRLQKALAKLNITQHSEGHKEASHLTKPLDMAQSFFVKDSEKCHLIQVKDVSYIEALGNYSRIHYDGKVVTHSASLSSIENKLDGNYFFKISRSCIVQLSCITHIEPWVSGGYQITLNDGAVLEVSRRQAAKFKQQLLL